MTERRRSLPFVAGFGLAIGGVVLAASAWAQVMFLALGGTYEGVLAVYGRCWEVHSTNAPDAVIEACVQREAEWWPFASASTEVFLTLAGVAVTAAGLGLLAWSRPGLIRALDDSMTWRLVTALTFPNLLIWLVFSQPEIERPVSGGPILVLLHAAVLGIAIWRWYAAWRREGSPSPVRGLLWRILFYPSLCLTFLGLTVAFVVTVGGSLRNGLFFWQELGAFFLAPMAIALVSGALLIQPSSRRTGTVPTQS